MVLAAYILLISIVSLLSTRATPEIWGYFMVEDGGNFPITHWENVIGRSKSADIRIPLREVLGVTSDQRDILFVFFLSILLFI